MIPKRNKSFSKLFNKLSSLSKINRMPKFLSLVGKPFEIPWSFCTLQTYTVKDTYATYTEISPMFCLFDKENVLGV